MHDESEATGAIEVTALFEDTVVNVTHLTDPRAGTKPRTRALLVSAAAAFALGLLAFAFAYAHVGGVADDVVALVALSWAGFAGAWGWSRYADERRPRDFTIGTGPEALHPAPCPGAFPLVRSTGDDWELCVVRGLAGEVELAGQRVMLADLALGAAPSAFAGAQALPIQAGAKIVVTIGLSTFLIRRVTPPVRERRRLIVDWRAHAFTAAAALVVGAFLLLVNAIPPDPRSLALGDPFDNPRLAVWLTKPPAPDKVPAWLTPSAAASATGDAGQRGAGEAGRTGRPGAQPKPRRFTYQGPANNPTQALARRAAADQASHTGLIGVLRAEEGTWLGAVFTRDSALGKDAETAFGTLIGTQTGESEGDGALSFYGNGPGGGGTGPNTIGIGPLGRIGHSGLYPGDGVPGRVIALPERKVGGTPIEPIAGPTHVIGNLDRELVRRVVRSHMQEVRFCYERQLLRQPELLGRLSTQFTISATGQVLSAAIATSTLASAPVEMCVAQAVRRWQFPKPQGGGIVIVSYPFLFKPSGAQ